MQVREKQQAKAAEKAAARAAEEKEEADIRAYYTRQRALEQQQLQQATSLSSHTSTRSSPFSKPNSLLMLPRIEHTGSASSRNLHVHPRISASCPMRSLSQVNVCSMPRASKASSHLLTTLLC